MMISLLLLVPLAAMGLALGLGRLEDTLLQAPTVPTDQSAPSTAAAVAR